MASKRAPLFSLLCGVLLCFSEDGLDVMASSSYVGLARLHASSPVQAFSFQPNHGTCSPRSSLYTSGPSHTKCSADLAYLVRIKAQWHLRPCPRRYPFGLRHTANGTTRRSAARVSEKSRLKTAIFLRGDSFLRPRGRMHGRYRGLEEVMRTSQAFQGQTDANDASTISFQGHAFLLHVHKNLNTSTPSGSAKTHSMVLPSCTPCFGEQTCNAKSEGNSEFPQIYFQHYTFFR